MNPATGMQEEQNVGKGAIQRGPSGRLPAVRAKIARRLFENYGVAIAEVARQMESRLRIVEDSTQKLGPASQQRPLRPAIQA
jgi:hypothetical protein